MKKSYHSIVVPMALAMATRWASAVCLTGSAKVFIGRESNMVHVRKAVVGVVVALALAVSASGASIAGIADWKIVLAAAGAVLFVATGRGTGRTDQ